MRVPRSFLFALLGEKLVAEVPSAVFGTLWVTDGLSGKRYLRSGLFTIQSVIDRRDPSRPRAFPLRAAAKALAACRVPGDVLMLGLGGGVFARIALAVRPDARIVAVDPDPAAEEVARKFFALPSWVEVVRDDALAFLRRVPEGSFAFVFVDVFDRSHTPAWLEESAPLVQRALLPGGTAIVNTTRLYPFDQKQAAVAAAFRRIFSEVKVQRFPPVPPCNEVIVCWKEKGGAEKCF